MANRKLTVTLPESLLADWNAARKRRGLTQKQALEQMMYEWCYPERVAVKGGAREVRKFEWPDLLKGIRRGN